MWLCEEAVAVVRGLLGDLRAADRAVPHERRHAVQRARRRGEALQRRAELALPVDDVLAPEPAQQRVVLDRERDAVADVLAEPRVDRAGVAAAQHEVDAAVGQVLEHRVVLGDLHRVVRGDQRRRGRELQPSSSAPRCSRAWWSATRARTAGCGARRVAKTSRPTSSAFCAIATIALIRSRLGRRAAGGRVGGDVADGEDSELHVRFRSSIVESCVTRDNIVASSTIPVPPRSTLPPRHDVEQRGVRDERRRGAAEDHRGALAVPADRGLRLPVRLPHRRARRTGRLDRLAVRTRVRLSQRVRQPARPAGGQLPGRAVRRDPSVGPVLRARHQRPGDHLAYAVGLDPGPRRAHNRAEHRRRPGHAAHPATGRPGRGPYARPDGRSASTGGSRWRSPANRCSTTAVSPAKWELVGDRHTADGSGAGQTLRLRTDMALGIEGGRIRGRKVLRAGDVAYGVLSWADGLAAPAGYAEAAAPPPPTSGAPGSPAPASRSLARLAAALRTLVGAPCRPAPPSPR